MSKLERLIIKSMEGTLKFRGDDPCRIFDNPNYDDVKDAIEVHDNALIEAVKEELQADPECQKREMIISWVDLAYSRIKSEKKDGL